MIRYFFVSFFINYLTFVRSDSSISANRYRMLTPLDNGKCVVCLVGHFLQDLLLMKVLVGQPVIKTGYNPTIICRIAIGVA